MPLTTPVAPALPAARSTAPASASVLPKGAMHVVSARHPSLSLLPPSDIVVELDINRLMTLMMPKFTSMAPADMLKMKQGLDELMTKTGIDLTKITSVTAGFSYEGGPAGKGSGAILVYGLQPDLTKIATLLRGQKVAVKLSAHQGIPLMTGNLDALLRKQLGTGATPSAAGQEMAMAYLGENGLAIGDLGSVKSVIESHTGARPGFANALHSETLERTAPGGLVRFSAVIPESMRQSMATPNSPGAAFAAINVISGAVDVDAADGESVTIDLRARTGNAGEAATLQQQLGGFLTQGRALFSGKTDPNAAALSQVMDQIQINAEDREVSLSIYLPAALMRQFQERAKPSARRAAARRSVAMK
ncbi:MAG: hypothetical protein ACKV2V_29250 [Blastocatellia bacterium]